jgi:hypothetical protein
MSRHPALGTFVVIELPDGTFGYGRALTGPYYALYDLRTDEPAADVEAIEAAPVLFTAAVRQTRGPTAWPALGVRPLSGEVAAPVVRFTQDLADYRNCVIFDSAGMERTATPEECVGIELAAVWDEHHVEQRLLDTFLGRPNQDEISSRVRLS